MKFFKGRFALIIIFFLCGCATHDYPHVQGSDNWCGHGMRMTSLCNQQ